MKYKIAIVEDDKLILDLVSDFLKSSGKFDKISAYTDGTTFINAIDSLQQELDVIILDFRLGNMNAEMVLKELHEKEVRVPVIILTSHYNQYLLGYMIRAGASAYLPKNIKPAELLAVIEEVLQKGHYISSEQFPFLKIAFAGDDPEFAKHLPEVTEREIDVIYLLAKQLTAKEIADKLCVSPKTVEGYKNALFSKTGTKSVVGLVLFAAQNRWINIESVNLGNISS